MVFIDRIQVVAENRIDCTMFINRQFVIQVSSVLLTFTLAYTLIRYVYMLNVPYSFRL